jgi:predicted amidohydrolase YtcJ
VHCVTEVELVFALAGFRECGGRSGDRIEHAAVTPPALLHDLAELGLQVVTQPHFIRERGAAYRRDVPEVEQPWLYRGRGFLDAGVPLAAGSDAPFGSADPWQAMRAAITRTTTDGAVLGVSEALNPEQALGLFLGPLDQPPAPRRIGAGAAADLVLLDRPWQAARQLLKRTMVRLTLAAGEVIYDRNAAPGTDPTR